MWHEKCRMSHHVIKVRKRFHVCKGADCNRHITVALDGPKYCFHSFDHLYHVAYVVHGLSAYDVFLWGFEEMNIALVKMTFDGRMPQVNDVSGSAVVVRIGVVLQLDDDLVCWRDRVTQSHMFVRVMMCTGG
jgi:hypothetical protein